MKQKNRFTEFEKMNETQKGQLVGEFSPIMQNSLKESINKGNTNNCQAMNCAACDGGVPR